MTHSSRIWFGLSLGLLLMACAPQPHYVQVSTFPEDAKITFDDKEVGEGEALVAVAKHDANIHHLEVCRPPTHFCAKLEVTSTTPSLLSLSLEEDLSYRDTLPSDLINKEQSAAVQPDALTRRWSEIVEKCGPLEFDVLDEMGYYLRTRWKVAGKEDAPSRIRSRLLITLDGNTPEELRFKITIESEKLGPKGNAVGLSERAWAAHVEIAEALLEQDDS